MYVKDIIIFSRSQPKNIDHETQVPSLLQDVGIAVKLEKNSFFAAIIIFLFI